jgi:hypothetical protein
VMCPAGDIVISSRPINPNENIIKRVTAVQGQEVKVYKRGTVAPLVITVRDRQCLMYLQTVMHVHIFCTYVRTYKYILGVRATHVKYLHKVYVYTGQLRCAMRARQCLLYLQAVSCCPGWICELEVAWLQCIDPVAWPGTLQTGS